MKAYIHTHLLVGFSLFMAVISAAHPRNGATHSLNKSETDTRQKAKALMANQQVDFLENKGQMRDMKNNPVPFVLFKAEAPGVDLYVTETGLSYVLLQSEEEEEEGEGRSHQRTERIKMSYERIDMVLAGASIKKENVMREGESLADFNYFCGKESSEPIKSKKYSKLVIRDVYPGIDWVLYSSGRTGFKYDFIVHPGAAAASISMIYKSKKELRLDPSGDLVIRARHAGFVEKAPYTYLAADNQLIPSKFKIISSGRKGNSIETQVAFVLESDSKINSDIVIDPQLVWGTCYGGNNADGVYCIDTDPAGNLFICGYGSSPNFPIQTAGTYYQTAAAGGYILKFSNAGTLLWATFFGSPGQASGPFVPPSSTSFLATDQNGNVFLSGVVASGVFPLLNANTFYQGTSGGSLDAYIAKFSANGTLLWSTYYGGSAYDDATGLATDLNGNVFLVGTTQSANFPLQSNNTYFEASITGSSSGYIVKFDNAGNRIWSTYLKGCGVPKVTADLNGNVYLTGNASSLIPLLNAGGTSYYQGSMAGTQDAYLLKFTNNGTQVWGTYYGGTTNQTAVVDIGYSITTDKWANVFVTGATTSTNFPVMNPGAGAYFQATYAGTGNDVFILKFDANLNRTWATLIGGTRNDSPSESDNLSVDTCGNVWMGFNSASRNMPFQQACNGGFFDNSRDTSVNNTYSNIYLARFSNTGVLQWSSFFGGDGDSHRCTWDTDKSGNAFMVGEFSLVTSLATYPTLNAGGTSYYSGTAGGDDLAIAKFSGGPAAAQSFSYTNRCAGDTTSQLPQSIFSFGGGTFTASGGMTINPVNGRIMPASAAPGTYTITYYNSSCDCPGSTTLALGSTTFAVFSGPTLAVSASQSSVCVGQQATLTASGAPTYSWNTGPTTFSLQVQVTSPNLNTWTVSGQAGVCAAQQTVGVFGLPAPALTVSASQSSVCIGQQATLTASGAASYSWNTGPTTFSLQVQITSPNLNTWTVSSQAGVCSAQQTIGVFGLPAPVVTVVTNPATLCTGQQATLTAGGANTYQWVNGPATSTVIAQATGTNPLNYNVIGSSANGCTASAQVSIPVQPSPTVNITLSSTLICTGTQATLTAGGASTYTWNTGASGPVLTASATTASTLTYTVSATGANGCKSSQAASLTVSICKGITEMLDETASISIFPNPNSGEFTITCQKDVSLILFNEIGQHILNIELNAKNNHTLMISDLAAGIYFLKEKHAKPSASIKIVVTD